jgi:hypothetical protein
MSGAKADVSLKDIVKGVKAGRDGGAYQDSKTTVLAETS